MIAKNKISDFLRDNYLTMTNPQLSKALGLGLTTTRNTLYSLGLKRCEFEYWTTQETELLIAHYQTRGDVEIAEMLTVASLSGKVWNKKMIRKKRGYLGLDRTAEQVAAIKLRNYQAGRTLLSIANAAKKSRATVRSEIEAVFGAEALLKAEARIKRKKCSATQKKKLRKLLFQNFESKLQKIRERQERKEARLLKKQSRKKEYRFAKQVKKEAKKQIERQKVKRLIGAGKTREQLKAAAQSAIVGKIPVWIDPKTKVWVKPDQVEKVRAKYFPSISNSHLSITL